MIVEAKDVIWKSISEIHKGNIRELDISGLVFHSGLVVSEIKCVRLGDSVTVDISLIPARRGMSGRFALKVPLDENIRHVLFGPSRVEIWPNYALH